MESRERVGGRVDLQLFQFVVFDQDGNAQKICGREDVHHRGLQGDLSALTIGEIAAPTKDAHPVFVALFFGDVNLGDGAKELPQELPANRLIKTFQGLHKKVKIGIV